MEVKDLKTRDVFFKSERINGIFHLGTYNQYVQKDDAQIIQTLSTKQLANIANRHKRHELKKTKGGKPSFIARNFIISLPPSMESEIDRNNDEQMREMVSFITKGFLESIKKSHKAVDIKWLEEHMTIALHFDTVHTHAHIIAPVLVQEDSLFKTNYIPVDYAKRSISYKTRRTIYNWCKKHLLSAEVSEEHFIELAKQEKSKGNKLASWKKRKENLVKDMALTQQAREQADLETSKAISMAQKLADDNEKWIKKVSNAIDRLTKKIDDMSINYDTADKELNRISTMVEKTQNADIKSYMKQELDKVKQNQNLNNMR